MVADDNPSPPELYMELTTKNRLWLEDKRYDPYEYCIPEFVASFFPFDDEGEPDTSEPCAKAWGAMMRVGDGCGGLVDMIDVCDAHSQELYEVSSVLFSEEFEKKLELSNYETVYIHSFEGDKRFIAPAIFLIERSFCNPHVVAYGGNIDLSEYGFNKEVMPNWKKEMALWWIDTTLLKKDYPIPRPLAEVIHPSKEFWKSRKAKNRPLNPKRR